MNPRKWTRKPAFSLVELVVVIVIIGIIAAMAIPRLSRGTAGAGQSALAGNLSTIRNALNMYAAEHGNAYPAGTAAQIADKLTKYSDTAGNTSSTRSSTYQFGPYLLAVPVCPVVSGANAALILVDTTNSPPVVVTTNGEGWVYNSNTGEFLANSTATDANGKAYNTY
jgi:prepilin-type N-terminal cleavage/methylation domain-containing protein